MLHGGLSTCVHHTTTAIAAITAIVAITTIGRAISDSVWDTLDMGIIAITAIITDIVGGVSAWGTVAVTTADTGVSRSTTAVDHGAIGLTDDSGIEGSGDPKLM